MHAVAHLRVVMAVALLALAAVVARPVERPQAPALVATAAGDVAVSSSAADQAILDAHDLRPGDSATGSLTLSNTTKVGHSLRLQTLGITDRPGPGGGELSGHVHLLVQRTAGAKVHEVYSGAADGLTDIDLGALRAAEVQVYTFTATVPEGGPALDDPFAGASVELAWRWEARAEKEVTPEPEPEPETPPVEAPKTGPSTGGATDGTRGSAVGAQAGGGIEQRTSPADDEGVAPTSARPVRLWVGGARSQRIRTTRGTAGGAFELLARCRPDCSVVAGAKVRVGRRWITLKSRRIGGARSQGAASRLVFRLTPAELRRLRPALARGRRAQVRLTVTASAAAHGSSSGRISMRLRK